MCVFYRVGVAAVGGNCFEGNIYSVSFRLYIHMSGGDIPV